MAIATNIFVGVALCYVATVCYLALGDLEGLKGVQLNSIFDREVLEDAMAKNAVCNDGTPAVYYSKINPESTEWLFFLEGGADCYNEKSCKDRYDTMYMWLMTGSLDYNPPTYERSGFLSSDCEQNPVFCKTNRIALRYCSSDQWAGDQGADPNSKLPLHFRGKNIVTEVIKQVVGKYKHIKKATRITLTGNSAGGQGVFSNSDRVGDLLHKLIDRDFKFSSITDSSLFMPGRSFKNWRCDKTFFCNIERRMELGPDMWNFQPDESCAERLGERNKHMCVFMSEDGVYEEFKYPMMLIFFLYDSWQLQQDGIYHPSVEEFSDREVRYAIGRKDEMVETIEKLKSQGLTGAFGMNCHSHVSIELYESRQKDIRINGANMNDAVAQWFKGEEPAIYIDEGCDGIACASNCTPDY